MVWGNTYDRNIRPLQIIQRKAVCLITFSNFDAHTSPLFAKLCQRTSNNSLQSDGINSGAPAREARVGQSPIPMEYGQPLFVWLSRD